jgi:uncharacterized protein YbaR (Trm112 family)
MFIELTDHLRCPAEHEEAYLVLLPDAVVSRSVRAGSLGCPVCGRTFAIADGIAELGAPPGPPRADEAAPLPAEAVQVLLGLQGPGGYAVLVGRAAEGWEELVRLAPGVAFVAVNPPGAIGDQGPALSVLRAARLPLKSRSMRGVVLGPEYAGAARWQQEAARITLPGLRIVGQGPPPAVDGLELLATAAGAWVAARR